MSDKLAKGLEVIGCRSLWERKQRLYYQMRHDGLRRLNKPQWGADQHLPLIDMNITDLKPFWSAQVFGGERLCDFTAMRAQDRSISEAGATYHDFRLRHFTNYRQEMESAIDTMLLRGRGVLQVTTDPTDNHRIKFKTIDPLYILMPESAQDFDDADFWIYVQTLTVNQYKMSRQYNQDPAVIAAIRGSQDFTFNSLELDKQLREGVTHSARQSEIVLWHHWERTAGGYSVTTFSPQAPTSRIRPVVGCPYKIDGKASAPFFSIAMEIKDPGWYSPRGVAELNAAFEAYGCTLWNSKTDNMKFGTTPLFTSDKEIPNSANIRFNPGEFIPGGVRAVEFPTPSYSLDQEINFARGLAEQRAKIPDFGITEGGDGKPRTATENNRIAGLQNVGADYNGDVFRDVRLRKIYRHTWGLMVQYQPKELAYYIGDDLKQLPTQALHSEYLVVPTGGPANKQQKLQSAGARYQLFLGKPNIDQDELARDVLAADDPRLIRRLLIPTNSRQQSEAYEEALNIGACMIGYPAPVLPDEDHATRVGVILQFLMKQTAEGQQVDPNSQQKLLKHLQEHLIYLRKLNPEAFKQLVPLLHQLDPSAGQAQPSAPDNAQLAAASSPPVRADQMPQAQPDVENELATGTLA